MASTDLAVVAAQLPAYLRGAATSAADEFSGGIGANFPLAFLSTRGKEFRLRKDGQELNTRQREIKAVFVAARSSVSKRWYEKPYASGSTEAPDCSSKDGITPDVAKPVSPNCTHCPKNQWGSRITENGKEGKACSDYKRIILWLVGLTDDPVVLDVAATSLKAPKGQQHTVLMLGDYLSQLAKHGMDPTQVVSTVSFTDAEYPQLCFGFDRFVTEDEFAKVLELREADDVKTVLQDDVFEPAGEIQEGETQGQHAAEAEPEPVKEEAKAAEPAAQSTSSSIPAFPGKTTVMKNDAGELTIAEDEFQYALAWSQGYRPAQTAAVGQPAAEAKPPPAATKATEPEVTPEQTAAPAGEQPNLLQAVADLLAKKS